MIRAFLQAIQQNTAIQNVELWGLRLPTDISTFVDNASSITSFCIDGCDMGPVEREQGASDFAAALQRNTNIEALSLRELEDIYAIPILESLGSNTSVKTFTFSSPSSDGALRALHQLLDSTTSIQRFELYDMSFVRDDAFRPISQAITSSESVSELKFVDCLFNSENSTSQFRSVLHNKRNLTTLCLRSCNFVGEVYEDMVSLVSRRDSLLRCFEFQNHWSFESVLPIIQFKNLLRAIEKSKLGRFKIGTIRTQQQLQTLTQSIPSMKLTELVIRYDGGGVENVEEELLQAVKNNFTLLSVKGETYDGIDLFNQSEQQRLAFYANRNESLDQWVDKPETVEQRKVWPEALASGGKSWTRRFVSRVAFGTWA